jgi:hypothetical protein
MTKQLTVEVYNVLPISQGLSNLFMRPKQAQPNKPADGPHEVFGDNLGSGVFRLEVPDTVAAEFKVGDELTVTIAKA